MLRIQWALITAGLMLCPASAASAAEPGAIPPPAPGDVTVTGKRLEQDRQVCKSDVTTGSIIPTRVCKTKGEWEAIRQRDLATIQRLKDDRTREQHVRDARENR
jgi:hypothetical protein